MPPASPASPALSAVGALVTSLAGLLVSCLTVSALSAPAHASTSDTSPIRSANSAASGTSTSPMFARAAAVRGARQTSAATAPPVSTPPAPDATMALRDLYLARPSMTTAERRAARALLARPTDATSTSQDTYLPGAPVVQTCGGRVCVSYVTATEDAASPEWAASTLAIFEEAWSREVDQLGYRAPASDGVLGGDGRFDVYLAQIADQGLYGYCVPENPVPGTKWQSTAYCVVDNDMAEFPTDPVATMRVTAAHEFFHTIQFNYDVGEDPWLMESTATWMEEQVAGDINDNRQFLPESQLGRPGVPLDTYGGSSMAMYGNWILFQRLSQQYGVDSVRQLWSQLDASTGAPDLYSIEALAWFMRRQGTNWRDFYADFTAGNVVPARSYAEGTAYRRAPVNRRVTLGPRKRNARVAQQVHHLASAMVQVEPAHQLRGKHRLRIGVRSRIGGGAEPAARVVLIDRAGHARVKTVNLNRAGAGGRTVGFSARGLDRVVVVVANTSLRYRNCGTANTTWACSGLPRDDHQGFLIDLSLR